MNINPNALVLWAVLAIAFHLCGGNWLIGLLVGLCISLLAAFLTNK